MGRRGRRIRAVLDSQFAVIATVLFVAALAGAGMTYTAYAEPGTETMEQPGPEATYTGGFAHQATVEQSNPVFPRGETLSNRTVYFSTLAPNLQGTFRYRYTASTDGNVTVDGTLTLVIVSTGSGSDDSTVEYWRQTRQLDQATASLAPGESLELSFAENVTQLANESEQIDAAVGDTPGSVETKVVADIETEGTVNGQRVTRENQYELGISPDGDIYRVDDPGTVTNTSQQTRMVQVASTPGPVRRLGGPVLTLAGFGGLLAFGLVRYQGTLALAEDEQSYLTYETARAEFDDWITRARLPADALDGAVVEVDSLEGLVDIAIDSDRRVIEDGDGEYVVTVENLVYRYTAPPDPGSVSWSSLLQGRQTDIALRNAPASNGDSKQDGADDGESALTTAGSDSSSAETDE